MKLPDPSSPVCGTESQLGVEEKRAAWLTSSLSVGPPRLKRFLGWPCGDVEAGAASPEGCLPIPAARCPPYSPFVVKLSWSSPPSS